MVAIILYSPDALSYSDNFSRAAIFLNRTSKPCAAFTFSIVSLTCNKHWHWRVCVEYHSNVGTTSYTLEQALVELVTTQPTEQASPMKDTSALWINSRNVWNMSFCFGTCPNWTNYHPMKWQFVLSSL